MHTPSPTATALYARISSRFTASFRRHESIAVPLYKKNRYIVVTLMALPSSSESWP